MTSKKGLTLNQKLALLPAAIPDCVLDFLEDFNFAQALVQNPKSIDAIKPEYYKKQSDSLRRVLQKMRELGEITSVEGKPLPRQYPGSFVFRLVFDKGVRGLGCIVSQGTASTGSIVVVLFQEDGYAEDFLRERLAAYYKKKGE